MTLNNIYIILVEQGLQRQEKSHYAEERQKMYR